MPVRAWRFDSSLQHRMVELHMKYTYDPTKSKYTRELMELIVAGSSSYAEVLRKLGLKFTGSANGRTRTIVKTLGLDTSHFLGRASNCGPNKKGGPKKCHWSEILVLDRYAGRKEKCSRLRRAMIEFGMEHKCEECFMPPEWRGKPLTLQIDHRNGNSVDNRPGNPRFMCPNCHAQTDTFGSGNMTKTIGKKSWAKGRKKHGKPKIERIERIERIYKTKIMWPSNEELTKLVQIYSLTKLSMKLGVSDVAIKKRCIKFKIPIPVGKGIWSKK